MPTNSRFKSMASYAEFARGDAQTMANLLSARIGTKMAHSLYTGTNVDAIKESEASNMPLLNTLIQKSERQREKFLDKLRLSPWAETVFVVLAILGLVRVRRMLVARDYSQGGFAPGMGNRETAAAVYGAVAALLGSISYEWPSGAFSESAVFDDDDEDDGGDWDLDVAEDR